MSLYRVFLRSDHLQLGVPELSLRQNPICEGGVGILNGQQQLQIGYIQSKLQPRHLNTMHSYLKGYGTLLTADS